MARVAPVCFRVNPDVDPKTHPYIATGLKESKFGVAFADALRALPARRRAAETSRCAASTATSARRSPISSACVEAAAKVFALVDRLAADGIALEHVDLGGGLGIRYRDEEPIDPSSTRALLREAAAARARTSCCSSPAGSWSATPACC